MPFDDSNIRKMIRKQKQKRYAYPSEIERRLTAESKDLISRCMEPDVQTRLTTPEMLSHFWLQALKQSSLDAVMEDLNGANKSATPLSSRTNRASMSSRHHT